MANKMKTEVVVLGSGPGGYTAAFRAADLGKKVTLVERYETIGGVCLNVGCIPSKALLHAAKVIDEASEISEHGIDFGKPKIDPSKLKDWKNKVISKLTGGLAALAKQRKVDIVTGEGKFISPNELAVGDTVIDPFGDDLEDFAVLHFVEYTAKSAYEAMYCEASTPSEEFMANYSPAEKPRTAGAVGHEKSRFCCRAHLDNGVDAGAEESECEA
jgi:hypothetical protein